MTQAKNEIQERWLAIWPCGDARSYDGRHALANLARDLEDGAFVSEPTSILHILEDGRAVDASDDVSEARDDLNRERAEEDAHVHQLRRESREAAL